MFLYTGPVPTPVNVVTFCFFFSILSLRVSGRALHRFLSISWTRPDHSEALLISTIRCGEFGKSSHNLGTPRQQRHGLPNLNKFLHRSESTWNSPLKGANDEKGVGRRWRNDKRCSGG
ncbi:hypothetical protein V8F20_001045 [Naviculisporaceae sp. PSN 640]